MGSAEPLLEGRVIIAESVPPLHRAAVHVRLEDVSEFDRASRLVAEAVVEGVSHGGGPRAAETVVEFAIAAAATSIEPRREYAVRVWVDSDGDGREGPGDLYSTMRHAVLTRGRGRVVTVRLGPAI